MNDDLDAFRRVLAADVESFRRLVERYQRPLLTLIRNLMPHNTDHGGFAGVSHCSWGLRRAQALFLVFGLPPCGGYAGTGTQFDSCWL
jgi:hypothetical protein